MSKFRFMQAELCTKSTDDASIILPNNGNSLHEDFDTVRPPMRRRLPPREVLARNLKEAEDISVPEIVRRSAAKGYSIAKNTINFIVNGKTKNPGIYTIEEIAAGLDKPAVQLAAEFLGVSLNDPSFKGTQFAMLWDFYKGLSPTQKQKADTHIEALLLMLHHIKNQS